MIVVFVPINSLSLCICICVFPNLKLTCWSFMSWQTLCFFVSLYLFLSQSFTHLSVVCVLVNCTCVLPSWLSQWCERSFSSVEQIVFSHVGLCVLITPEGYFLRIQAICTCTNIAICTRYTYSTYIFNILRFAKKLGYHHIVRFATKEHICPIEA